MNLGSVKRGSKKVLNQTPAVVTEVSCPSEVMLGVMNIHWGRASFLRSSKNKVVFLILASLSALFSTEPYKTSGLDESQFLDS